MAGDNRQGIKQNSGNGAGNGSGSGAPRKRARVVLWKFADPSIEYKMESANLEDRIAAVMAEGWDYKGWVPSNTYTVQLVFTRN
jgi:hypothetical protein